jgi:hypothetical protein
MMAERLQAATAHLTPPFAVVDLDALDDNATSMIIRAGGLPYSTSDEVDPMPGDHQSGAWAKRVPGRPGVLAFRGHLARTLRNSRRTARIPTLDRIGLTDLAEDDQLRESIMVMVDSAAHCLATQLPAEKSRSAWTSTRPVLFDHYRDQGRARATRAAMNFSESPPSGRDHREI